ncbi:phytoene dehydrogenase-like oxidoreductase [Terriglobus roseus DSM 18391]|uniref:Phytoene dehydrogenase-like oxidoreductase n=1 Tax=Terriglobus roseus (strain DSM 18391 / NRRL B-41598 / KBS 63) TaxID=926566 RepID=I3ZFI8_TERRK|nr:NAD(P)/FAD-dependent oxidoreductase [Terriglobus roseus]AFL88006.1 phytoene dehydrogenase-like oxidoreductase [Terriglobus roseus DSM 18391]
MKHAVIVGSGPNGLSAGVALARAGVRVTVFEAAETIGGGVRTEALTLPGFLHDAGAAVFPLGIASPFFKTLPLREHGLQWIEPDVPLAHPLDGGDCVGQMHDLDETAALLGQDGDAWRALVKPLMDAWPGFLGDALGPMLRVPRHPLVMARFGLTALQSASFAARTHFKTERARTLFAGLAGHSNVPLHFIASAAPGLVLAGAAHATGWPIARGGAQSITNALGSLLQSLGGVIHINSHVDTLRELPSHDAVLLDVTARQFVRLAGEAISERQREPFERVRQSPGVFKVDWALSAPIPWSATLARRAGTVHLGGSFDEIAASELSAWEGRECERPYILLSQPSLFDSTRAPAGMHTAWAYCHVPNGSAADYTARIEAQVERFAPGFRATILARHTRSAPAMEAWNANLVGGDVSGGAMTLAQIVRRPTLPPYRTPIEGVYLCSSSTPPGGGVHGMCGWSAAAVAAKHMGVALPSLGL